MEFRDIQPRNFLPSRSLRQAGDKRREHVMLIGGRDGPAVAGLPPRDPKFWSEGEQARWTRELESDSTYPDAKTQSRFLREVRPEQRLYGHGYMKVKDMTEVLLRNLAMTRGRPLPTELTLVQENGELLALPLTVREGPVFTGLLPTKGAEDYRGTPITWSKGDDEGLLQDVLATAAEFTKLRLPVTLTLKDGTKKKVLGPTLEGGNIVSTVGDTVSLADVQVIDLLDPDDANIQDKPFFARLVGVMGEFEGNLQLYPYFLIARLRPIRRQRDGLPVPQASTFLGDVSKTEKTRQKAAQHLQRFAEELWAARLNRSRKHENAFMDPRRDPVTGFDLRVDQDKTLYWVDSPSSEFDPVALLRPLYPGAGAIVVNVDDYLRLSRMVNALKPSGSVKSNPHRGSMRHFGNPVHYLNDRELQAMAASEGLSVPALLKKYQGHVLPKSERPRSASRGAEPAFMSAGRRAAATGAGLRLTRSNPFNKVTEPGPGKIQVTSKRGKTLYMTQNQIAKMGDKMLMPGEVQRALGRSNPRTFRGVKEAMSPSEKERARLMRKHSGTSATHLLTSYDPEEQMVGEHMERKLSRQSKKASGTYGSVNDEVPGQYDEAEFQKHMANLGLKSNPRRAAPMRGLDTEEAWQQHLQDLRAHAPDSMYRQFLREYAAWKRGKRPHLSRGAAMVDDYLRREIS